MNCEQVHAELVALAGEIVKDYRNDLLVHDLDGIRANGAECPFLHFSRETGTYMLHLIAASAYPAKGKFVPYLFGHADRDHILSEAVNMVNSMANNHFGTPHVCHYFDGRKVRKITMAKAVEIIREYEAGIRRQWSQGVNPKHPVTVYVALGM